MGVGIGGQGSLGPPPPPTFWSIPSFVCSGTYCMHTPTYNLSYLGGGRVIFKASVRVIIHKINSDWFGCVLGVVYAPLTHDLLPTSMYRQVIIYNYATACV